MTRGIPFNAESVGRLSAEPGVYLFHGGRGEVLYVGKAKSLRVRVRSYLGGSRGVGIKTRELVRSATTVETLVVASEEEALILEANLIKEHQPRFNIQLRDDKKYPYVKVTVNEPFPRAFVTRRVCEDGSRYFGPLVSLRRRRPRPPPARPGQADPRRALLPLRPAARGSHQALPRPSHRTVRRPMRWTPVGGGLSGHDRPPSAHPWGRCGGSSGGS